jgi:hypothetical protein
LAGVQGKDHLRRVPSSLFAAAGARAWESVSITEKIGELSHGDLQLEPQLQEEAPEQPQSPAIVMIVF